MALQAVICSANKPNPLMAYGATLTELLDAVEAGRFSEMASALEDAIVSVLCEMTDSAAAELSDVATMVICGNTIVECIAAGIDPRPYAHSNEAGEGLFGCDVDYLAASTRSIAAGEAYFAPCLSGKIGGDIPCGLLAIDILHAESPVLFIDSTVNIELAIGDKSGIAVAVLSRNTTLEEGIAALLDVRNLEAADIAAVLVSGDGEVELSPVYAKLERRVGNTAIEGASAVLLSADAEDELCRIFDACICVEL